VHKKYVHADGGDPAALEHFRDHAGDFARRLHDDCAAVHLERSVERQAQILCKRAVGIHGRFQYLGRTAIGTHDAGARAIAEQHGNSRLYGLPHRHSGHFLGADDEDVPVPGCQAGCQR
jgi:hypothetical protein